MGGICACPAWTVTFLDQQGGITDAIYRVKLNVKKIIFPRNVRRGMCGVVTNNNKALRFFPVQVACHELQPMMQSGLNKSDLLTYTLLFAQ